MQRIFEVFYKRGWLVLVAVMAMWSANVLMSRLAVGQISPMTLVCLRWLIASTLMFAMQGRDLIAQKDVLKANWRILVIGGTFGFTAFNALFYLAGHYTTGVNIAIVQGSMPVFIMLGAFLVFGTRFSALQIVGLVMTIAGVVLVAAHGDLTSLAGLAFNLGDLFVLIASIFYAAYTLALRNRPKVAGMTLFAAMSGVAFLTSIPLLGWEIYSGAFMWPTLRGWLVLFYVALFPSLIAQVWFIRGVELIGPSRAGLFGNLMPVLGTAMSVVLLGEGFKLYHAIALLLVIGGIYVAERLGVRR